MNKKADRALAVLRGTRTANVSDELRSQRLLLEGRALSDTGRPDLALEVIANLDGREVTRLRSDILWSAKRWDESAEQIELMYGDRYKDFAPLSDVEQQDILRAEIGYALSSDAFGLARFREKYAAKMAADAGCAQSSRSCRRRSARAATSSPPSRMPRPRSIRSTASCAT